MVKPKCRYTASPGPLSPNASTPKLYLAYFCQPKVDAASTERVNSGSVKGSCGKVQLLAEITFKSKASPTSQANESSEPVAMMLQGVSASRIK